MPNQPPVGSVPLRVDIEQLLNVDGDTPDDRNTARVQAVEMYIDQWWPNLSSKLRDRILDGLDTYAAWEHPSLNDEMQIQTDPLPPIPDLLNVGANQISPDMPVISVEDA